MHKFNVQKDLKKHFLFKSIVTSTINKPVYKLCIYLVNPSINKVNFLLQTNFLEPNFIIKNF